MSFSERATMAFLEEDNAQRAFFRLRPLLNSGGPCSPEELTGLPDEGYLRIVPDKNEQPNFKDRMRNLGRLCLIDLTPYPQEANKIRTNKNYAPDKGEKNQYILYSDAIHTLPDSMVYEIAEALAPEEIPEKASSFLTPLGYVRLKDQWYGPIGHSRPLSGQAAEAPAEEHIHTLSFPDGKKRHFYWPPQSAPAVPPQPGLVTEAEEMPKPLKPSALLERPALSEQPANVFETPAVSIQQRLRPAADHDSLSGTPLYTGVAPRLRTGRPRNPLNEVVEAQWRAARLDAPSAQLQQGASLRHVENPLEQFRELAERVWAMSDAQAQVVEAFLALPEMHKYLEKALHTEAPDSLTILSMRRQLQELEAERLALLIQLDKAKENKAVLREEALAAAHQEQTLRLKSLREEIAQCQASEEALRGQIRELMEQRDALQALCDDLARGELKIRLDAFSKSFPLLQGEAVPPVRIIPASGIRTAPARLIAAVEEAFQKAWPSLKQEDAVHFLVLLALCPRIQVAHASLAEGARFAGMCMEALGLKESFALLTDPAQTVMVSGLPCSAGPACVAAPFFPKDAAVFPATMLLLTKSPAAYVNQAHYELAPWPVVTLSGPFALSLAESIAPTALPPISPDSLKDLLKVELQPPEETFRWLQRVQETFAQAGAPLPAQVLQTMAAYLKAAGYWMHGGIAAAMDYAFEAWAVPLALSSERLRQAVNPLLLDLPKSAAALKA